MFNGFQEFGIVKLLRALAAVEQAPVREWVQARGYERYLGSSVKGEATIDWSDKRARAALLSLIVADADRLLELSRQAQGDLPEDSEERQRIVAAAELLGQLLLQDVERADDGVGLKDGVSRDRFQHGQPPQGYLNPPRCGGPAATRQLAQWRRAIRGSNPHRRWQTVKRFDSSLRSYSFKLRSRRANSCFGTGHLGSSCIASKVDMSRDGELHRLIRIFLDYELPEIQEFRHAQSQFKTDLPTVLENLRATVAEAEADNPEYQEAASSFLDLCRRTIGPAVSPADVREMLLQHILTKDIFLSIFREDQFHRENNVARQQRSGANRPGW